MRSKGGGSVFLLINKLAKADPQNVITSGCYRPKRTLTSGLVVSHAIVNPARLAFEHKRLVGMEYHPAPLITHLPTFSSQ